MAFHRILVLADTYALCEALTARIQQKGYEPIPALTVREAAQLAETVAPDLIVVSLGSGRENAVAGRKFQRYEATRQVPVLSLVGARLASSARPPAARKPPACGLPATCERDVPDLLHFLEITLFDGPPSRHLLECEGLALDVRRHRAFTDGREIVLTPSEFRLLECLLRQPGRAFRREDLVRGGVTGRRTVTSGCINQIVARLRRKIGDPEVIQTVPGVGFRLRPGPQALPFVPLPESANGHPLGG